MDRYAQLKSMLIMAAADGGLTQEELHLLSDRAILWGLTAEQFESIVDEATGGEVEISIPAVKSERIQVLVEVVRMMGADGQLHDKERELFALMAAKMELTDEEVNQVIDKATEDSC